jgi:predicted enzyme related to lactoylglutathione lyase
MLDLNSIMIGTMQPDEMAAFYKGVFGKDEDMTDGNWHGWQVGACFFSLGEHSEMAGSTKEPGRIMFNLATEDVQGEFERIKGLGATVEKEPYEMGQGMWIATFSDPDGNFFQLMSPWDDSMGQ